MSKPFLDAAAFGWTALLEEHHGPYRGVLRHHLALVVPEPRERCGIRVGDQVRHRDEGSSLVVDDTDEHEAWINDGILRAVSRSPFVKDAWAQHVAREQQFAAAWGAVVGATRSTGTEEDRAWTS